MTRTRTEEFDHLRPLLFSIAYHLLGSVSEAEDAVHATGRHWHSLPAAPADAQAHLTAHLTRTAMDLLRAARARRAAYTGTWLPEPLLTDPHDSPAPGPHPYGCLPTAILLELESLEPLQRAVFVLDEVFALDYRQIAAAVGRPEAACRELAAQARRLTADARPRPQADRTRCAALAARFFDALKDGDAAALRDLLAPDAQLVGDGGGKAPQLARTVTGDHRVARLLTSLIALLARVDVTVQARTVNSRPGALLRDRDDKVLATWTLDVRDGHIHTIHSVTNPDKLAHLGPVADAWALNREAGRTRRALT
ncbi:sigma factor-like helix-turn-helix DNA-binding protein [Streptomyces galbus]|uniref:RNA polymerase subunit sigma-24 n=1 Tax=Streptomyces galbus TaxID=33898 RepID=A0A4U5WUK0_STRGB|nr:sigma factor-like helix-turn-helix DNA-binding protein [Streptomyces galbus]TKT05452.1 RNA polymerase subunit sigma-24 [Streptomyces galbus]GHD53374.1 RNA polymerase sigma24 factor [Streptomyces galbus]